MLSSGMTGYDIFSSIRSQPEFDGIPIIAMSVMDRSKAVPEVKKRGFSGYISKPISFQEFPKQIGDIIARQNIW